MTIYTAEIMASLIQGYQACQSDEERLAYIHKQAIALKTGMHSIIAKLRYAGVYITVERKSKITGEKPKTKEQLVEEICELLGLDNEKMKSMAKTDKAALLYMLDNLN